HCPTILATAGLMMGLAGCTAPSAGPSIATVPAPAAPPVAAPAAAPVQAPALPNRRPGSRPSSAPTLDEVVTQARAVYLARVERAGGLRHYYVTEVWRTDPSVDPTPAIGAEALASPPKKEWPGTDYGEYVVVSIFSPPLPRPIGGVATGAAGVFNGDVRTYR